MPLNILTYCKFLGDGRVKFHKITCDDMLNGDGLRVVVWLSGCSHKCEGCHNPITWDSNDGVDFNLSIQTDIINQLKKSYIDGITFTGGDPLYTKNRDELLGFIKNIKKKFPLKTIWMYTGYTWEEILLDKSLLNIVKHVNVLVDGKFDKKCVDVNYPWAGSLNQRVIDIQQSIKKGKVVLNECH